MKQNLIAAGLMLATVCNALSVHEHKRDVDELCDIESIGYFITPQRVTGEEASNACVKLGGKLADITAMNVVKLSDAVNHCIGTDTRARIQTWESNSFGTKELAIQSNGESGYGTVHIATEGEQLHALCAKITANEHASASAGVKPAEASEVENMEEASVAEAQEEASVADVQEEANAEVQEEANAEVQEEAKEEAKEEVKEEAKEEAQEEANAEVKEEASAAENKIELEMSMEEESNESIAILREASVNF